ncbi:MAG: barstar family protein [Bacillota bacterium]|jgi:RNAse (barnase) inhibitor barstar|nr:barstar family protein [Bacillota bacterium]NLL26228.1 barstar family protein [Erysipelotrichia bacterium]
MNVYVLNGKMFSDKNASYSYLKKMLPLPVYFSKNLDSLYDCLVDYLQNTTIILINQQYLLESLGEYGQDFISVFDDAAKNIESFIFIKQ